MRKLFYLIFVNNRVIDFIGSPFMSIVIPPIVALYYGTLDIWGDDWHIVKDYKSIHETIFSVLAGTTALVLFIKGIAEQFRGSITKKYHSILQSMVACFNELVKKKRDRFFQEAKFLKPNIDVFKKITQPKNQIEYALDGTKRLLHNAFGIDPKNIAITIIQGKVTESKWWYEFKCDTQKQHTVVVYGQFICTPYDEAECRACEELLDEISDRVELELYLHSMKSFKETGGKAA